MNNSSNHFLVKRIWVDLYCETAYHYFSGVSSWPSQLMKSLCMLAMVHLEILVASSVCLSTFVLKNVMAILIFSLKKLPHMLHN